MDTRQLRIAILDMNAGHPNEGMRCINSLVGKFLDNPDIEGYSKVFDVRTKNEVPEIGDFDIFISSGGPGSPKRRGKKWEKKYYAWLDGIFDHNLLDSRKKYLFLVCHSFQLACQHWNLAKVNKRKSKAFGIMPVHLTKKGEDEVLLQGLQNPFYAVDSRDYQVIKPKKKKLKALGAKVVCKEKIRPHVPLKRAVMGIRFTPEIFGVQFHPEADAVGMRNYFNKPDIRQHIVKHHGEMKFIDMMEHLDDDDKILKTHNTIIPRFLHLSHQALSQPRLVKA